MARLPRIDVPGLPQHVIQRGNNRGACFFHPDDYRCYLEALGRAATKYHCRVHSYTLMTNHVHLLLTGEQLGSVSSLMQSLGRWYVRYINRTYRRTGTLWEGRFKASVIESERYLLTCYRYIELNPVRAALVTDPGAYPWTSYHPHALQEPNPLIQDHDLYLALGATVAARCQAYQALVNVGISEAELGAIRDHVNKGRALGSARFQEQIEAMLKRRVRIMPPGRPPKPRESADVRH
jgi:putative transposase